LLSFGVTFAQVTLTGVMESTYTMDGAKKGLGGGTNGGSEFRLGGVEDLGNGLKADFNYAFLQDHNTGGTGLTNYNSYVGLGGDFGTLKIGKQFTPLALATWGNDAAGGAANSSNLANGSGLQANGSVTYTSPNFSGVTVSLQANDQTTRENKEDGTTLKKNWGKSSGYSLTYATGAFSASYASNTNKGDKAVNGLGASYDFGMAKVFISSLTQSGEKDATGFGISAPLGAATLIASYSEKGDASAYELTAKYNLSKRTMAYFQNKVTDESKKAASVTVNSIGIRHDF
jgi:predicted porin